MGSSPGRGTWAARGGLADVVVALEDVRGARRRPRRRRWRLAGRVARLRSVAVDDLSRRPRLHQHRSRPRAASRSATSRHTICRTVGEPSTSFERSSMPCSATAPATRPRGSSSGGSANAAQAHTRQGRWGGEPVPRGRVLYACPRHPASRRRDERTSAGSASCRLAAPATRSFGQVRAGQPD